MPGCLVAPAAGGGVGGERFGVGALRLQHGKEAVSARKFRHCSQMLA